MSTQPKKHQQELTVTQQHYQGVIPPPHMMEHFARIDPSLPDRIMTMAEKEGDSRRMREASIINKSFFLDVLGYISGVAVVAGVIWLCWQFIQKGYADEAKWVASSVMVALAAVFVIKKAPGINNNNKK